MRRTALAAFFLLVAVTTGAAADAPRRISVTGEGMAAAAPDMAVIALGVVQEAANAAEAMQEASRAMQGVVDRLEKAGIAARDVQTANIALNPQYDRMQSGEVPRVIGYVASNDLNIRVRDLDKLGGLLDALVKDGANRMNGISFTFADPGPLEDAARKAAVKDARERAELLAAAAGVGLGRVIRIDEPGGAAPPVPMQRAMTMDAAVPVAGGEIEIHRSVTIVWSLKD